MMRGCHSHSRLFGSVLVKFSQGCHSKALKLTVEIFHGVLGLHWWKSATASSALSRFLAGSQLSFPLHKVLQLVVVLLAVKNPIYFVLFLSIHFDQIWRGRGTSIDFISMPQKEPSTWKMSWSFSAEGSARR